MPGPGMLMTDEDAWSLAFDLREIDEIVEIVGAFDGDPDSESMRRLRVLPQGQEGPDEEGNTRARDTQYELLLWSALAAAGIDAALSEPDVAVTHDGEVFCLEAKRPKTLPRLDDRLKKAASQLKGRGPSIVAISLDLLVRPTGQLLHVQRAEEFSPAVAQLALTVLAGELHHIVNRVKGTDIAALVFTTRVPGFVQETRLATLGTHVHTERLVADGAPGYSMASAVHDALASVL